MPSITLKSIKEKFEASPTRKNIGILIIIFQILYWITIQSSIKNKVVEGFDLYFRDIFYMPDFDLKINSAKIKCDGS